MPYEEHYEFAVFAANSCEESKRCWRDHTVDTYFFLDDKFAFVDMFLPLDGYYRHTAK